MFNGNTKLITKLIGYKF